jgi:hypothetical protein
MPAQIGANRTRSNRSKEVRICGLAQALPMMWSRARIWRHPVPHFSANSGSGATPDVVAT